MVDVANGWMAFKVHGQWYKYRVLPFGLKRSPWIFPKLTGLLLWHWRSLGGMVAACNAGGLHMVKHAASGVSIKSGAKVIGKAAPVYQKTEDDTIP